MYPELAQEFFKVLTEADDVPKYKKYRRFARKIIMSGAIFKSIPLGLFALEKCFKKWILMINYIKQKGYEIVLLDELLQE